MIDQPLFPGFEPRWVVLTPTVRRSIDNYFDVRVTARREGLNVWETEVYSHLTADEVVQVLEVWMAHKW